MDVTRRAALAGFSALLAVSARAQTSRSTTSQGASQSAALDQPAVLDMSPTSGRLKESVQKGQVLTWRDKQNSETRLFELSNISVGLLRSETGGEVTMTFSCNISSLGYMTSDQVKLEIVSRTKAGAAIYSWSVMVPVKCGDSNQTLPPQTHGVPKEIANNLFPNIASVEIAEYRQPNSPELKVQRCN
jgi:hypothetical protein